MIPNIVHFNYGLIEQKEDFLFPYYIAVLSCKVINNPSAIYFHYHYEPKGYWWEKTKELVELIKVEIPTHIGQKEIKKVAHKSDILRLETLIKYGGVYLDIDTICIRSYRDLLNNKFVIGHEITESGRNMGLCNAIMISEPNNEFMLKWKDSYESYFNPDGWQEASMLLPLELSKTANDITILKSENFLRPSWENIKAIFEEPNEIDDDLIVLHYWNQYSHKKYLVNITNFDWVINNSDTLYGKTLINLVKKIGKYNLNNVNKILSGLNYKQMLLSLDLDNFNEVNKIRVPNKQDAITYYISNKNNNLYLNSLFINDLKPIATPIIKLFFKTFDLVSEISTISNYPGLVPSLDINYHKKYIKVTINVKKPNTIIQLKQDTNMLTLHNLNDSVFYTLPEDFSFEDKVEMKFKTNISLPNITFDIKSKFIDDLLCIKITRENSDWGWNENLYLDFNYNSRDYYYYVGKSFENTKYAIIDLNSL